MIKKALTFIFLIFALVSCSTINNNDKNTDIFIKFVAREQYMREEEPYRIFNPGSAMLIATLPEKLGNLTSVGQINDFEVMNNGLGYSKRYKNKSIKKGYWVDFFAYHSKQSSVSEDINDEIVMAVYNNSKADVLKLYKNSRLIGDNVLIFTTPSGKILKMREAVFEYWNPVDEANMRTYIYFGTNLDSFYKVRITYNLNLEDKVYSDKEIFIKDLGYYYTEGMSLKDFNEFKKSGVENPVKMERERAN